MRIVAPYRFCTEISVRDYFGISNDYYAIAKVIEFICSDPKNEKRVASGDYRKVISKAAAVKERTLTTAIKELKEKGILEAPSRETIRTTKLWYDAHGEITEYFNSGKNCLSETEEENLTQAKIASHSGKNCTSTYIYTNDTKEYMSKPSLDIPVSNENEENKNSILRENQDSQIPTTSQKGKKFQKSGGAGRLEDKDRGFEEFWRAYPRKEGKTAAVKAWGRLYAKKSQIMGALASYAASLEEKNTAKQYIKLPASFLGCYTDYLPEESVLTQKTLLGASSPEGSAAVSRMSTYEDDKAFEKSLVLLKLVAGAIAAGKVSAQNANANAFAFVDTATGARIFDDRQAVWIEDLGGLAKVSVRYKEFDFDDKALSVWLNISALAS